VEINRKKYRGICVLQEDKGRDTEIVIPIVYAAERFLNCRIEFVLKWNAHLIYKHKPDFVIVPANCVGSRMYHRIAKYCHSCGIKVFSFVSEGNFITDADFDIFGFNPDRTFYQEFVCAWNQNTFDYFRKYHPAQAANVVLTGAPGFDRYKIYKFADRRAFLEKYGKEKFTKVVSYSGWAFGKLQYKQGIDELMAFTRGRADTLVWVEKQRAMVSEILRASIVANPDILFILKQHPAEYYPGLKLERQINEMSELAHFPNVIYLQGISEDIHDLISVTDILLGFETTTAIETWLMKSATPTILINPDPEFPRSEIRKGCANAGGAEELQSFIAEFYSSGKVAAFNDPEVARNRERITRETIGFSDGMNHIRTLYYLNETLLRTDREKIQYRRNTRFWMQYVYFRMMKPFYSRALFNALPKISKTVWVFERQRLSNIAVLQEKYAPFLDLFYRNVGLVGPEEVVKFWKKEGLDS